MNAPIRLARGETPNPSFVRELCIALEHRWEPERLFVIFTAYFDESGTHGGSEGSPAVTMAGFVGTGRQWELFGRRLNGLKSKYGFKIFHANHLKGKKGEFKGWSDAKGMGLINDLTELIRDAKIHGVSMSLDKARYQKEYRDKPRPKKMPLDSSYGLCFRACLSDITHTIQKGARRHNLHIVLEHGHPNVRDACRVFDEIKGDLKDLGIELLGEITVAKKTERELLMVADFLAHSQFMIDADERLGKKPYPDHVGPLPDNQSNWSHLDFQPDAFDELKANWERGRLRKIEEWRAAKAARKASSEEQPS